MWPRFWLFLLSKNCKWEYLGTKHEEINCNIYLSSVPEGIFPRYISSADWETVGSWPRLATASTLSSLERSCDCDVGHVTVMWVMWLWYGSRDCDMDHVTDVDHVTVTWIMWLTGHSLNKEGSESSLLGVSFIDDLIPTQSKSYTQVQSMGKGVYRWWVRCSSQIRLQLLNHSSLPQ